MYCHPSLIFFLDSELIFIIFIELKLLYSCLLMYDLKWGYIQNKRFSFTFSIHYIMLFLIPNVWLLEKVIDLTLWVIFRQKKKFRPRHMDRVTLSWNRIEVNVFMFLTSFTVYEFCFSTLCKLTTLKEPKSKNHNIERFEIGRYLFPDFLKVVQR